MAEMDFNTLKSFLEKIDDNSMWEPFCNNKEKLEIFISTCEEVRKSEHWSKERNKEKGVLLEKLMEQVFEQFVFIKSIEHDRLTADNEVDLYIHLNDTIPVEFINRVKGCIICECKNVWDSSINVGVVSKLSELCDSKGAGLGIFVSIKGISGSGWVYGEGKRRKLYIKTGIPIISFTLDEIEQLQYENYNFYTIIRRKINELVDEVEFDGAQLVRLKNTKAFIPTLLYNIESLKKLELLTEEETAIVRQRIEGKYNVL